MLIWPISTITVKFDMLVHISPASMEEIGYLVVSPCELLNLRTDIQSRWETFGQSDNC